jgi:hydrogenase maturation protease
LHVITKRPQKEPCGINGWFSGGVPGEGFGSEVIELKNLMPVPPDPTPLALRQSPLATSGVLIVGLGDESRGDGGIGLHLAECLSQLDWPGNVVFVEASDSVPLLAEAFAHIVLLDALDGPESPGALYKADPEGLLTDAAGGPDGNLGLLPMLSAAVRKRATIFGVQPANRQWGSSMSRAVVSALPVLVPYLRAFILQAARRGATVN